MKNSEKANKKVGKRNKRQKEKRKAKNKQTSKRKKKKKRERERVREKKSTSFSLMIFNMQFTCFFIKISEAAIQRCSYEKGVLEYAANLQKNTHAEVRLY